jgi:hypothetical protein
MQTDIRTGAPIYSCTCGAELRHATKVFHVASTQQIVLVPRTDPSGPAGGQLIEMLYSTDAIEAANAVWQKPHEHDVCGPMGKVVSAGHQEAPASAPAPAPAGAGE